MEIYILIFALLGVLGFSTLWIPVLAKKINISYPVIYLVCGYILFYVLEDVYWPSALPEGEYTLYLSELAVIVALTGAGLKIDRRFSFENWNGPIRFMLITMALSITGMALLGIWGLGLTLPAALLLGAALAPTDPVLAEEVQVEGPNKGTEKDIRYFLTVEAGLNDGLAFPFVWLAVALAIFSQTGETWFINWITYDLIYRILVGLIIGFTIGKAMAYLFLRLPEKIKIPDITGGGAAISLTLLVYGLTELCHGYGFIAVFVAAVTLRNYEMGHEYHEKLYNFSEQVQHILLAVILVLLGGSIAQGILNDLTFPMVLAGLIFVGVIRPISGYIGLVSIPIPRKEKFAISFFGLRGVGSIFYLSFGLKEASFVNQGEVWALLCFIIILSIVLHGLTAPLVMKKISKKS